MTDFVFSLNGIYSPDSEFERLISKILLRKYQYGSTLIGHPLFFQMLGNPPVETVQKAVKSAQKKLCETYPDYMSTIKDFEFKDFDFKTWRGDYLVFKKESWIHVDIRDYHYHELTDADDSPLKIKNKLKTILRDMIKEELCALLNFKYIVVSPDNYQTINYKLAKL